MVMRVGALLTGLNAEPLETDAVSGAVALVTGGASGIGAATVRALAEGGASVIVADRDRAAGEELVAELGRAHRFVELDVTDPAAWAKALADVEGWFGRLNLVHLNAGVMTRPRDVDALDDAWPWSTEDAYRKVMAVNCDGAVLGLVQTLPLLEASGGGRIVVTSSCVALGPFPVDPFYAMSKAALVALVRSMGPVLAPRGVVLTAVCPEGIATPLVAPDLVGRRVRENRPSISADVAGHAIADILRVGRPGEAWMLREDDDCIWPLDPDEPVQPITVGVADTTCRPAVRLEDVS
jgi:NAD(P)-dependent dehydrogenase (short-subunit alcohol dehydrogenase family)